MTFKNSKKKNLSKEHSGFSTQNGISSKLILLAFSEEEKITLK